MIALTAWLWMDVFTVLSSLSLSQTLGYAWAWRCGMHVGVLDRVAEAVQYVRWADGRIGGRCVFLVVPVLVLRFVTRLMRRLFDIAYKPTASRFVSPSHPWAAASVICFVSCLCASGFAAQCMCFVGAFVEVAGPLFRVRGALRVSASS